MRNSAIYNYAKFCKASGLESGTRIQTSIDMGPILMSTACEKYHYVLMPMRV